MTFDSLALCEPLLRGLEAAGYTTATPIQQKAIPPALEGRDILGCAQTGTGKTAAFALPILQRLKAPVSATPDGNTPVRKKERPVLRALVLTPTRELAVQIGESLRTYGRFAGLRHAVIFGGVGQEPQVRALRAGVDVLVATPGRLLDLMQQGFVKLSSIEILILDEADHMLDMGFIHDMKRIVSRVPTQRQTLMFSATMPPAIRELAAQWLQRPVEVSVAPVASTPERVVQKVCFVDRQQKPDMLARLLREATPSRALVFSRTKHGADKITRRLEREGIRAIAIHGNKSQSKRTQAMKEFHSKEPPVLVATDLAARGLDFPAVSHVINFDLPDVPETYVHRIGRTARAGADGIAISFCDREERNLLRMIERLTRNAIPVFRMQNQPGEQAAPPRAPAPARRTTNRTGPARPPAKVVVPEVPFDGYDAWPQEAPRAKPAPGHRGRSGNRRHRAKVKA